MKDDTSKETMKLVNQLSGWANMISMLVSFDDIKALKATLEHLNDLIVDLLNIIDKDDIPF